MQAFRPRHRLARRAEAAARWVALGLALLGPPARAHLLENTPEVASQTTVQVGAGQHDACGMQFTSVDASPGESGYPVDAWDVNLSVMRGARPGLLVGTQKTELARIPSHGAARTPLQVQEAWFLQEGTPIAKPVGPATAAPDGKAVLTSYEGGVVLKALADAANGEKPSFLLGIQLVSEATTRIYRFTPRIGPSDATAFIHCASALLNQELVKSARGR